MDGARGRMSDKELKDSDWSAWSIEDEVSGVLVDDATHSDMKYAAVPQLMDTVTRIGGEVSRLRAEVDGLLEQNSTLMLRFQRLLEMVQERGTLTIDDFELACDVLAAEEASMEHRQGENRKARH